MTTQIDSDSTQGLVKKMRTIRDELNNEIKEMSFDEQRAYLDGLLSGGTRAGVQTNTADKKSGEHSFNHPASA